MSGRVQLLCKKTGLHMIASVLAADHHLPIGGGGAFGVSAEPQRRCQH